MHVWSTHIKINPLQIPAEKGNTWLIRLLLTRGVDINSVNRELVYQRYSRFQRCAYLQYRSGLNTYADHQKFKCIRKSREVPEVYTRVGPPGTGKSRWLDEQYGLDKWIEAPDNNDRWFDGCDLADIIVFNDVGFGSCPPLDIFKKLCDRYPFRGAIKGGFIWLKPKIIVFTSHSFWTERFGPNLSPLDKEAMERRITDCVVVE